MGPDTTKAGGLWSAGLCFCSRLTPFDPRLLWKPSPLCADLCRCAMAGVDDDIVWQSGKSLERDDHVGLVRAGDVDSAVAVREQHISAEHHPVGHADEDDVTGIVPRQEPDIEGVRTQSD